MASDAPSDGDPRQHMRPTPPAPPRRPRSERTLTASEAANLIGVSIATVRGWADTGLLPSHRTVGGHRRFDPTELKDWLRRRGAAAAAAGQRESLTETLSPCPLLARALREHLDQILDRVRSGYSPDVPTPYGSPDDPSIEAEAARFVASVASALEAGSPRMFAGRMELAGVRGALQPDGGASLAARHARFSAAIAGEADAAVASEAEIEEQGRSCLLVVLDHSWAAIARGLSGTSLSPTG